MTDPQISLDGLTSACVLKPQTLGRRGSQMVVDATAVPKVDDKNSGLALFNLRDVFTTPGIAVGFGTPNTYLIFPNSDGTGWDKLNAFMFYRGKSYVAGTKDRVQSGVLFELLDLNSEAAERIKANTFLLAGDRSVSCAHLVAKILAESGFTSPGGSLQFVVRPSELAWLLWEYGLHYQGHPVALRPITTSASPNVHFRGVWKKEVSAPARLVTKIIRGPHALAAPIIPPSDYEPFEHVPDGRVVNIGIARPSTFGAKLGLVFGEQPIYSVEVPEDVRDQVDRLGPPLQSYPGVLDWQTKMKSRVLFSRPVVHGLEAMLEAEIEEYRDISAGLVPVMMKSSTREHETAYRYNFVLTGTHMRLKRLASGSDQESKFVQWMLAKHVLLSGYSDDVRLAGEIWAYKNATGQVVLVVNANSGTYKPDSARLAPAAELVSSIFGAPVILAEHAVPDGENVSETQS